MSAHAYDAVVLSGGAGRRLGGVDKAAVRIGGRTLLARVLTACEGAGTTVVVGGRHATARPVTWAREDPPGGGPLAALAAGVRGTRAPLVLVLSVDLPFVDRATADTLVRSVADDPRTDGALLVDGTGRDQPLVAVYRTEPLHRRLALLTAEHGSLSGLPLRRLTAELALTRVTAADPFASFDCDTWENIAAARARIREHGHVLDEWITAVKDELGLDLTVDTPLLLDLARDAAHGVARPAAPLTTFLVGYAAGRAGAAGPEAVAAAAAKATALAARWAAETETAPDSGGPGSGAAGSGQTGSGQASPGQAGSGAPGSGPAGSGQAGSGPAGSGGPRSGQAGPA
ncbi:DUF6457 domain-containing protein [Streptomyces sp. NPDC088745]|uniref:DUF6457 domain-containing protein n=1 Tax=Streptomyces sp. NPDC088745 TaxID=3365884 RepID=UPI0037FD5681